MPIRRRQLMKNRLVVRLSGDGCVRQSPRSIAIGAVSGE